MPVWVPEGYSFSEGIYEQMDKSVHRLRLKFQNQDKQNLSILEVYSSIRGGSGYMYDSDDAQVKEVQVRGNKAHLIKFKDGSYDLLFVENGHQVTVSGFVTENDMMTFSEKLQYID